jgi:predicted metal-dependent phosphoesterase TrpH
MLFDLHVHTDISPCSVLRLEDVLGQARARGLDGVCITDHDTMEVRHYCREGIQPDGLCVIFGMEYATSQGDFLVFGPTEEFPRGLSARELLRRVDGTGGVAVAAHPFRKARPASNRIFREGLCGIAEGVNGRNRVHENELALTRLDELGVSLVGGSDAHRLDELGKVATRIHGEIRSREGFVASLKDGLFDEEAVFPCPELHFEFLQQPLKLLENSL